ncbi:MAG: transposase [Candidatus Thermoplasmatota archaeon]|nr:transposase [Candidatus Thermoplasmatota archaeon]MBU1941956.1 transposase [Candidatus Thermoplasmatota archaeon]
MHSQEQLELLLENPIVQELLEILENEGKAVLQHIDLSYINQLFEQRKKTKKGRPRTYLPSDNLKALLYGLAEGKHTLRGISRTIKTSVAQVFLGLEDGMSYATLNRFWHQFATVAESVFKELAQMIANLGILGGIHAVDSTSISTPLLDDADAVWSYDSTKKEFYYGYGLLLVVDVQTQLPIAAQFVHRKQASKEEWTAVIQDGILVKKPGILLGDSGLDIVEMQEDLIDEHVLPIISYNPRNTDEPLDIKYRVEDLVQKRTDKVSLNRKELARIFKKRSAVENTNNVLKQMGLEDLHVKGWNAVKTHVYIILILRLAIAIARYCNDQHCNLRKISIGG